MHLMIPKLLLIDHQSITDHDISLMPRYDFIHAMYTCNSPMNFLDIVKVLHPCSGSFTSAVAHSFIKERTSATLLISACIQSNKHISTHMQQRTYHLHTHTTHTTCLQYIPFHNLINYDAHTTCEFSLMEDRRRFCFCLLDLWPHYLVETMIIFALSLSRFPDPSSSSYSLLILLSPRFPIFRTPGSALVYSTTNTHATPK